MKKHLAGGMKKLNDRTYRPQSSTKYPASERNLQPENDLFDRQSKLYARLANKNHISVVSVEHGDGQLHHKCRIPHFPQSLCSHCAQLHRPAGQPKADTSKSTFFSDNLRSSAQMNQSMEETTNWQRKQRQGRSSHSSG